AFLSRKLSRIDGCNKFVIEMIADFTKGVDELHKEMLRHQRGDVGVFSSLSESRNSLTEARTNLFSKRDRIRNLLSKTEHDKWVSSYVSWKSSGDGETGIITNKKHAW